MKIIHIIPGSGGGFYCENCVRSSAEVRALRQAGHEVIVVPMYLPLFGEGEELAGQNPIFYGAISLYLGERWPWLPRWFRRLFDQRWILRLAGRRAGATRASGLEEMTLSMLRGQHGRQARELRDLVAWLRTERPDVVHLSNALLSGLAPQLERELAVPVVCSLQDEDVWLNAMVPETAEQAWQLIRENAAAIAAFVPVSRYYADCVRNRLQVLSLRFEVIHPGIDVAPVPAPRERLPDPPVIGYLSRVSEGLGFGMVADAFACLKSDARFRNVRLHVTGGMVGGDRAFYADCLRRLERAGVGPAEVVYRETAGPAERQAFLAGVSLLSVPVLQGEAYGVHLLEAMAAGVPVVQPQVGAFPELIDATGGGILYQPNTPPALAAAWSALLAEPARLQALGRRGREAVFARFNADRYAASLAALYADVVAANTGPAVN